MLVQLGGNRWLDASFVDNAICRSCPVPLQPGIRLIIRISQNSSLLIDAVVRLLAYGNQLAERGVLVTIDFEGGLEKTMGYLDRVGFFDHLDDRVTVLPARPEVSGALMFGGGNDGLVEIGAVRSGIDRLPLLDRLVEAVRISCSGRSDFAAFEDAMSTILSELIDNVYEHGGASATGHAALQRYSGSKSVRVVVSDDGDGLMQTIRPALGRRDPRFISLGDADLLIEMFRDGLSRIDDRKRGNGLKGCAAKAIRFNAKLEVRLASQRVSLVPVDGSYGNAYTTTGLMPLKGTHIAFVLPLV
ncbi:ATP-binding protein [Bosea sp. UNC402CLCol]|uniref:ATP-binding protein n=1 Tax=Bosea sp. UNC402CLCol TaxID=1510531 RepID=UPI00056E7E0F|nr:ATP-binding protein [Bosea sp. UNC402CLCol]